MELVKYCAFYFKRLFTYCQ